MSLSVFIRLMWDVIRNYNIREIYFFFGGFMKICFCSNLYFSILKCGNILYDVGVICNTRIFLLTSSWHTLFVQTDLDNLHCTCTMLTISQNSRTLFLVQRSGVNIPSSWAICYLCNCCVGEKQYKATVYHPQYL